MIRRVVTADQLDALCAEYAWAPATEPKYTSPSSPRPDAAKHCAAYLRKVGPAISGQRGHDRTYQAARIIWNDFALDESEGYPLLEEFNRACDPPWSEKELRHKWGDAVKAGPGAEGRGYRLHQPRNGSPPHHIPSTNGDGKFASPSSLTNGHAKAASNPPRELPVLINMGTVTRRKIDWLWYPWLAAGEMALVDGDPGMAKSTLTLDWIARLTRGWPMPPSMIRMQEQEPARVVILSAEDDPAAVIRPRLDAAGANCELVDFFPRVKTGETTWRLPSLPDDLELLAEQIPPHRRPKLVVIDPLMAFVGSGYDSNKDADIRHCLHRANDAVRSLGAALLVVRHLNKMNLAPALYRGGGSIGIVGAARIGMTVGHDPADRQKWVVAQPKNNLAPKPLALVYRVVSDPIHECGKIEWLGESDLTPDEILSHDAPGKPGRPAARLQEAIDFLRDELVGGNVSSAELDARAEAKGIRFRTLKAARKEIGVESFRIGTEWFCRLPEITPE